MLAKTSAREKRRALSDGLKSGSLLRMPGAFSPLFAMQIEEEGFDGVYISGAGVAADLGLPDIALTTLSEVSERGGAIARATNLPSFIDADTGFGEPMHAARTMRALEEAGIAGCHMEDQESPKRCGHLDNKSLVPVETMVRRLKAAVDAREDENFVIMARTDARASEGMDAAIDRAKAYMDAGADAIFPEAMQDEAEYETFRKAIDAPLLANLTEFGKTPLLTTDQLTDLGYNMVIYPVTLMRLAMKAARDGLREINKTGTQAGLVDAMQTREELYELLRYADYNQFDQSLFNFKL